MPLARSFVIWMVVCSAAGCQQRNQFVPPPPPEVTVATPLQRAVTEYFQTTGTTRAAATVELRARVGGFLQRIEFRDGDLVSEGDLLFVIDRAPYEAALESARAELARAEAQRPLAEAQLARARTLVQQNVGTREQFEIAQAEREVAVAGVAAAQATVRRAELDLSYTEVYAPFSGRIGRHLVDVGNLVTVGTTHLATIEAVDPIHAFFNVSEADLLRFLEMQRQGTLRISDADPIIIELAIAETEDYAFRGRLDFREFGVDPTTGTAVRRATFENSETRLIPGLFVRLRAAVGDPRDRLLVEERAVSSDQRGDYLLLVDDEGVVQYRQVRLGRQEGGLRVIEEGLNGGERVVINGLQRARPGTKVNPTEAVMGAALVAAPAEPAPATQGEAPAAANGGAAQDAARSTNNAPAGAGAGASSGGAQTGQ